MANIELVANSWANKPRGREAQLPHGGLPEVIPAHLVDLIDTTGGPDGVIGLQFVANIPREAASYLARTGTGEGGTPNLNNPGDYKPLDSLKEGHYEVAPGLVHKYAERALWTITRLCAAYCRFCTRERIVGVPKGVTVPETDEALAYSTSLSRAQIDETLNFIEASPLINEIILSGGDPLTVNPQILEYVLGRLGDMQRRGTLGVVRIGTRLPFHNPSAFRDKHFEAVAQLENPYIMFHVNHAKELIPKTRDVLNRFRKDCLANVLSQTVLLRGTNIWMEGDCAVGDEVYPEGTVLTAKQAEELTLRTLKELFTQLAVSGVRPYYVFFNDRTPQGAHFDVPHYYAIQLWQKLRPLLSGVAATARLVEDVAGGRGKVAAPEGGAWDVNYHEFEDFDGNRFPLDGYPQSPEPAQARDPNEIAYERDLASGLFRNITPGAYVGYHNGQLIHIDPDKDQFFSEVRKRGLGPVFYQQIGEEEED